MDGLGLLIFIYLQKINNIFIYLQKKYYLFIYKKSKICQGGRVGGAGGEGRQCSGRAVGVREDRPPLDGGCRVR